MELTRLLKLRGMTEEVVLLYREALAITIELFGEDHPNAAYINSEFGRSLYYAGQYVEAEKLLRRSVEHHRQTLPEGHWRLAYVQTDLGSCLTELARYADAEPLLLEAYESIKAKQGPQHKKTIETLERIVALYTAWDKRDQAAEYLAIIDQTKSDSSP